MYILYDNSPLLVLCHACDWQVKGDHASYYRDALRYLGCVKMEDMPG